MAAGAVAYVSVTPPPAPKGATVALGPAASAPAKPPEPKSSEPRATPAAVAPVPAQPPAPSGPRFDIVRVAPDGAAVIAGRATPGSSVTVRDGEQPLGSVKADGRGEWVLLPDQPLTPGTRELNLSEQKPGAAEPIPSERVVVVMVPEATPSTGGASSDAPSAPLAAPLAVAVPRDGLGPSTVLQAPTVPKDATPKDAGTVTRSIAAPPPPGGVSVESMDYDATGQVAMGGRAQPGSAVQLYLDNLLVGRAHTDPDGRWRLSPERAISPGVYTLRADQVTEAGKVTARVELPVQVSEVPANLPEGRKVVVQPGNSLWRIARSTYGHGVQYTQIYQANRDQIRDPDLIYPGQIFALPVAN
nr:LysM peptidoglycan-binding domain-containing protein [Azospirillum soli]